MPEMHFSLVDWCVFIVYLIFVFALGAAFTSRQKSTDEFFRAGKRMGWFPILVSLVASAFSAISFLGQPARIYKSDATVIIGVFISSYFFLPIFAYAILPFYRKLDITTAYEYLERRFSLGVRCIGSGLFILQRIFWMALVCLAPSLVLGLVMGIKVEYCILIIGLIATVYTTLGGKSAVIWTDVVQFFVLVSAEILFFAIIITKIDGGLSEIIRMAVTDNKIWGHFDWDVTKPTFWTIVISSILMGLGFGVDQVNIQTIMTARNEEQARKSILYQLLWNIPRYSIIILMGISMYAFFQTFPEKLAPGIEETPDMMLPYFVMTQVPAGLCGLIIAGVFAAAMSSFDSGLNCIATVFIVDWYKRIIKPGQTDTKYLFLAKSLTVMLGISITLLSIVIYKSGIQSIVDASNKYIGFFFGPIVGMFLLGIFTRKAKPFPVLFAAVISVLLVLVLDIVNMNRDAEHQIINIYFYGPIAIIGTVLVGYLGSLFGQELPYDNIRGFTLAKKHESDENK